MCQYMHEKGATVCGLSFWVSVLLFFGLALLQFRMCAAALFYLGCRSRHYNRKLCWVSCWRRAEALKGCEVPLKWSEMLLMNYRLKSQLWKQLKCEISQIINNEAALIEAKSCVREVKQDDESVPAGDPVWMWNESHSVRWTQRNILQHGKSRVKQQSL